MDTIKRINKKVWIVLIIGLVIQILFDPLSRIPILSENIQARVGFPNARAKWEAQNIAHYSFQIRGGTSICILGVRVEVRNGEVIRVNPIDLFGFGEVLEESLPPTEWATSKPYFYICDYANFTMPQFFDELEQSLQSISRISFDAKYGYISEVRVGIPDGVGLLNSKISHCCYEFTIENFQVLDE